MEILLGNLFVVYISSFFARLNLKSKILEKDYRNYNNIFIFIALVSLIMVCGFRYNSGTDYWTYMDVYKLAPQSVISEVQDPGFTVICKFLNRFSDNPQLLFLVSAIITNVLIVNTLRKQSTQYELSMYLYITAYVYYSTFNGVRQWIAAAIVFSATKYLFERKFKKYLIIVIIATFIHASALIMIPVYFIVNNKPFSINNLIVILIFIGCSIAYVPFINILFRLLEGTQYAHYFDIMAAAENGANLIRLPVYFAPLFIFGLFYNKLNPNREKKIDIIFNICILGFLIMVLATKQMFFARLIYYFDLYYLLLVPRLVKIGCRRFNRLFYYILLVLYFASSYVLLIVGDSRILPYSLKITLF